MLSPAERVRSRRLPRGAVLLLAAIALPVTAAQVEPECGGPKLNTEVSIKACTRLIEFAGLDRPELAKTYYVRGGEWATQGNHDRAVADFTMAIELDPQLPGVYYNRALSFSEKGEHERAIADYDAALKAAPKDTKIYLARGAEWSLQGDYKRSVADYEQAIRLDSKSMAPYFGRGRARFYAGEFMAAASDFIRAHQIEPSSYTAIWLFLARKRADIAGEQTLAQEAGTNGAGGWPAPIVGLYLNRTTPEEVQQAAASLDPARQRDQRCEANFYIAHWHLLRRERDPAVRLLDDARRVCAGTFLEHEGAVAELRRLQQ